MGQHAHGGHHHVCLFPSRTHFLGHRSLLAPESSILERGSRLTGGRLERRSLECRSLERRSLECRGPECERFLRPSRGLAAIPRLVQPTLLPLGSHEVGPEGLLSLILVVSAASQAHAFHGRFAAARHGIDMVELEKSAGFAPVSSWAHEGASALIALPDRTFHVCRHVPRPRAGSRSLFPRLGCFS